MALELLSVPGRAELFPAMGAAHAALGKVPGAPAPPGVLSLCLGLRRVLFSSPCTLCSGDGALARGPAWSPRCGAVFLGRAQQLRLKRQHVTAASGMEAAGSGLPGAELDAGRLGRAVGASAAGLATLG